tara:strand:- start:28 stop:327 length:300 start_codon:yes stop_codon:yes gene_type:complete
MSSEEFKELKEEILEINKKLDLILQFLEKDVKVNCDKMGEHIDFVENVYDNVKNPLGYLCNKINFFSNKNKEYTLENIKEPEDGLKLTDEEIDHIMSSD